MALDRAHERLRMRDFERVQQETIERGGEQRGAAEPEGEQQRDGEVGYAVVAGKHSPEDSRHAASSGMISIASQEYSGHHIDGCDALR